jgi:hypothetical protein
LTDDVFAAAERQIGHALPMEYIGLLKIQNGGYINYTFKGSPPEQILCFFIVKEYPLFINHFGGYTIW